MKRFVVQVDSLDALEILRSALVKASWSEEIVIPRANGRDVVLRYSPPLPETPTPGLQFGDKMLLSWSK